MQAAIAEITPQNSHSSWKNAAVVNAAAAAILGHQGAGDIHGQDSKDDGVVSGVENGEVGTLLRVVGQAGLSRLGNDALAGVADDVQPFRFLKVCHGP